MSVSSQAGRKKSNVRVAMKAQEVQRSLVRMPGCNWCCRGFPGVSQLIPMGCPVVSRVGFLIASCPLVSWLLLMILLLLWMLPLIIRT